MTVKAKTSKDQKNKLENKLSLEAKDIISTENLIAEANKDEYSSASDEFNTYRRDVYLNLRKIVVDSNEHIVIPEKGYGVILCSSSVANNLPTKFNVETDSSISDKLEFLSTVIRYPSNTKSINYNILIPEYYQLVGYVVSDTKEEIHSVDKIKENVDTISLVAEPGKKYWITAYIKPNSESPNFYHWNYKKNELGKIKIDNPIEEETLKN